MWKSTISGNFHLQLQRNFSWKFRIWVNIYKIVKILGQNSCNFKHFSIVMVSFFVLQFLFKIVSECTYGVQVKNKVYHIFFKITFFRFLSFFRCESSYYEEKIVKFYLQVNYFKRDKTTYIHFCREIQGKNNVYAWMRFKYSNALKYVIIID